MQEISEFMEKKIDEITLIHEHAANPNEGVDEVAELAKLEKAEEAIPTIRASEEIINGIEQKLSILLESQRAVEHEINHVPQYLYPEANLNLSTYPNRLEVKLIYTLLFVVSLFLVFFELNTLPSYLDAMGIAEPGSLSLYLPGLATSIYGIGKNCNIYLTKDSSSLNTKKKAIFFTVAFFIYVASIVLTPSIPTDIWSVTDLPTAIALSIDLLAIFSATVWILNLAGIITHTAIKLREARRQGQIVTNPAFLTLKEQLFTINQDVQSQRERLANHAAIIDGVYASLRLYMHQCVLFYQSQLITKQQERLKRQALMQSKQKNDEQLMEWYQEQAKLLQQEIDRLH